MLSFGRAWRYAGAVFVLLVALALVLAACALFLVGIRKASLVCSRGTHRVAECSILATWPARYEIESARPAFDVNAFHRLGGGRGAERRWEIVLYDERGEETPVATLSDTRTALAFRNRIESALEDPSQRHFEFALPQDCGALWLLAGAVPLATIAALAAARRVRGLRRRSPPKPATSSETIWTVSVDPDDFEPGPEYWRALWRAIARRLAIVASLFVLYELARFGFGALRSAAHGRESKTQGFLELTAEHRCRFRGTWVFPGTTEEFAVAPGRYELSVFDVASPDHWQTQTHDVALGRTTRATCRPLVIPEGNTREPP